MYLRIFKITHLEIYTGYTYLSYICEQMREYMRIGVVNTVQMLVFIVM